MPSDRGASHRASVAPAPPERLEDLYESAPVGYLSTLPDGTIIKANETLLSWLGYGRDELVGHMRWHDLLAPGARIYYETHYAPLLQLQGSVREIAAELLRADGTRLPVLLNSELVRDDAGRPHVVRTTVFDASERRRYERELQRLRADAEARARGALALAHVHDGVLLATTDGRIDAVNPAAELILGLDAAAAVGRPLAEIVPEWASVAAHAPVAAAGSATRPAVAPLTRGAHEQWLAIAGADAGEGGIVWTFRDVTADRALEQLRADVVAVVSHELRTPLTGVYGAAQTLSARYEELGADVRKQLLAMVVDEAERLRRLVDQILLTSQLDSDAVNLGADATFDADAVVESALSALPDADRRRVTVEGAPGAVVRADADSTRQVLENVIDNGLKYSDGPVRVQVEPVREGVRFVIADDGPGIPPSARERVFEKFYRLDPGQRQGGGGAGLGLYIARQLTERLGGSIELGGGDRGTTVVVELPAAAPAGSVAR